jgi:hypothetical protein
MDGKRNRAKKNARFFMGANLTFAFDPFIVAPGATELLGNEIRQETRAEGNCENFIAR